MPLYDKVVEIIVEQLGVRPDLITPDASFIEDLGADSLDTVELIMAFEEEFGIEIPDEEAVKVSTVGTAVAMLAAATGDDARLPSSYQNVPPPPEPPPPRRRVAFEVADGDGEFGEPALAVDAARGLPVAVPGHVPSEGVNAGVIARAEGVYDEDVATAVVMEGVELYLEPILPPQCSVVLAFRGLDLVGFGLDALEGDVHVHVIVQDAREGLFLRRAPGPVRGEIRGDRSVGPACIVEDAVEDGWLFRTKGLHPPRFAVAFRRGWEHGQGKGTDDRHAHRRAREP